MNIFVLDEDPRTCARLHVDKHVVKMITESAQLLCSAYYFTGQEELSPYKLSHKNHPCAKWVRESLDNWIWLRKMASFLYIEYKKRYGWEKEHLAGEVVLHLVQPDLPSIGRTPFALAMPEECKVPGDAVASYHNYYRMYKTHIFSWRCRDVPEVFREDIEGKSDV